MKILFKSSAKNNILQSIYLLGSSIKNNNKGRTVYGGIIEKIKLENYENQIV